MERNAQGQNRKKETERITVRKIPLEELALNLGPCHTNHVTTKHIHKIYIETVLKIVAMD